MNLEKTNKTDNPLINHIKKKQRERVRKSTAKK